jgi:hypothetical protein
MVTPLVRKRDALGYAAAPAEKVRRGIFSCLPKVSAGY